MGGESQKASLNQVTGYSKKAQRKGNPAYLEPNSSRMQKPIEGRSVLALFTINGMQKKFQPIYKGGGSLFRAPEYSPKTPFKTLIAEDAILILAILASTTIQQHRIRYQKQMQLCTSNDAE